MSRPPLWWAAAATILVVATALRLPQLDRRVLHGDEAIHAWKFDELRRTGRYVYDPHEYHGPTLYYFTFPTIWLSRAGAFANTDEWHYRLTPALFGVGAVGLALALRPAIGGAAALWAALFMALSPALGFYSRYYIQESLLAFFMLGAVVCLGRAAGASCVAAAGAPDGAAPPAPRTRLWATWWALGGVCAGLAHASKETCIISFGCAALAVATIALLGRPRSAFAEPPRFSWTPLALATALAIGVSAAMYSGFGTHPRGALDSLAAYATYFERAGDGGALHHHPWWYYLRMLSLTHLAPGPWWSEALILGLAAIGAGVSLRRDDEFPASPPAGRLPWFLALYSLLLTLAYSVIPYKTPWCAVQFLQPLAILAGIGAERLIRTPATPAPRVALAGLLLAGAAHLGWQAWRANFRFDNDYRNPYVYAHPLRDVPRLAAWAERLAEVHPDGRQMLVRVVLDDPWPLPWALRKLERVGYWETPSEAGDAPMIITRHDWAPQVRGQMQGDYHVSYFGLRPDVTLTVMVERRLYDAFLQRQATTAPATP